MEYPTYSSIKSTNIDWLGDVPEHWDVERLRFSVLSNPVKSEVACLAGDTLVSFVPMEAVAEYGGMDLAQEKMLEEVYNGYTYFKNNDVVIAKITPCFENGKGSLVPELQNGIGFGTTEFHVLRALASIDEEYLFYLSISDPFRTIGASEMLGAGGQKRIPEDFIKDFRLGIPPIEEQQKIATFLDYKTQQIDQLIEKKKALIEKLEEKRIAVITQAVTKGLDKNVKLKPTGVDWLGDVPEHWGINRLRFLLSMSLTNGLFKKAEFWGRGKPIVNVFDAYVHGDIVDESSLDRIECDDEEYEKYSALDGDFFFVRSSLKLEGVGKSATILSPKEEVVFECHLVRGRPDKSGINPQFLNLYLNSKYAREYFVSVANVVTMATIDQMKLKNLTLVMPALGEQNQIVSHVEKMVAEIDAMHEKATLTIEKLNEYRSSLITATVTGKIDVRKIKIPKEAA